MTLLELKDVTAYYGPVQVLEGVSLSVPDGGAVGILGANGAGKTTTLRAISGTVRAGGSIVASAGLSNVIIAHSDNPDFISTLYRSGAWLVLDAVKLRGCFSL